MTRNVVILLCMISLSSGVPMDEQTLQHLLDRKIKLSTTNELVTLRNLYGSDVNVHNFNPGIQMIQFFTEHPNEYIKISLTHVEDSETARDFDVPFDYIAKAVTTVVEGNSLLLIKGGPGAGKTRIMRMIELATMSGLEPILAVYVDLPQILNSEAVHISNSDDLLRTTIGSRNADFVRNVAEVNPSRVKILMDNFDKIALARREQILTAVSELQSKRIGVVISSTTNIASVFNQGQMNPVLIDIPPLCEMDFEHLIERYYEETFEEQFFELNVKRILEYSKALRLLVFETPLPRSVGIVKQLISGAVLNTLRPFPPLLEFLGNPTMYPSPKTLLKLSDNMYFDKAEFYRQILPEPSVTLFESEVYGIQALKMLLEPVTDEISDELNYRIEWSNTQINQHGTEVYKLMIFESGAPVDFLHREYKRYYAAKYIADSFVASTPLTESFKKIIHDSKHSFVAEFINSAMIHLPFDAQLGMAALAQQIATTPELAFQIADNLISHRLDLLCSKMFMALGQEHLLIEYVNNPTILKSQNKYSFGMLSEVRNVDKRYYIPRKTPWIYSGNRIEMILNLKLTRSRQTLLNSGYTVDPNIELISASRQSFGVSEVLEANRGRNYPVEVLNRAMYESIKALGPDSIQNMRALKARGSRPTAIKVKGRTLAHEAARWHSRELLEVVHEEFLVSLYDAPDKSGQTILFELLDHALPSNAYIQENAWESIAYLAEHGHLYANERIIQKSVDAYRTYDASSDNVDPSYRNLIVYDDESMGSRRDTVDTLRNFIPIEDANIPRETLSMRRLLITKHCLKTMLEKTQSQTITSSITTSDFVTVAELVLSHKPIEYIFQFHHYQNAMKYLLTNRAPSFNLLQLDRVSNIIVKNMFVAADFIKITEMIRNDVVGFEPQILPSLKESYNLRIQNRLSLINIDEDFESRAVETVYDFHPDIMYKDFLVDAAQIERNLNFAGEHVGHGSDFNAYDCVI